MAKANNQFEALASEAAARIERAREAGEQLQLLPPEPDAGGLLDAGGSAGRGKGKAVSQFREYLVRRGFRLPEEVLAEMAGLASSSDAFTTAIMRTEQVCLAFGAHLTPKGKIDLFMQIFSAQLRAADALLPYGLAKVQSDAPPPAAVQVNVMGYADPGRDRPRDVTPTAGRIAPPPLPHEMQQKQGVENDAPDNSDDDFRTEGPSR